MQDPFRFGDQFGPCKIVHVYQPEIGLKATAVVDNVAMGPSIGGLRIAEDVTTEECFRLARAMTLKNAAAGLPHGGGKSVMLGDPAMPIKDKETRVRCFAKALANLDEYIIGPDMGTDEQCMAWVRDEIGRAVGLPGELGGIPLDEIGATGWGVMHAADVAGEFCDLQLEGARVVVQGFGAVGQHAAYFMVQRGAVLVGASDSRGSVYNEDGLVIEALAALKRGGRSVADSTGGRTGNDPDAVIGMECDIWVPAARPDVIREDNVDRLRTRMVVQGANIPVTVGAEKILHERGVLSIPDFIANAGGVICAAVEYAGGGQASAFETIEHKIRDNTRQVLTNVRRKNMLPREAARAMAEARVRAAMATRRWSIF